jgi:kynureninase
VTTQFRDDAAWAGAQDEADPLSRLRGELLIPPGPDGAPSLYFAGHSLGPQPRRAREYVNQELDSWAQLGVEGHFKGAHPWMPYHELLTAPTARLVGALPHEVVVMNTLTVNLHLMMVSFYRPTPERHRIAIEAGAFPSDQYAVASQARFHGHDPREAVLHLDSETLVQELDQQGPSISLVLLGQPNYLTGEAFDVPELVRLSRKHGFALGLDCAHGAGNLMLRLHDWGVDFAVWCNYKYLNAGPGGLGGAFVHERHARRDDLPRLAGWWGHDKATRFRMGPDFSPIAGAEGWQLSNPPILQLAALRASMELFDQGGINALRARGDRLTAYLEWLVDRLPAGSAELATPREPSRRGSMLTLRVRDDARSLADRLLARGAVTDFRHPDILRLTPTPLYGSWAEVQRLAGLLREELSRAR